MKGDDRRRKRSDPLEVTQVAQGTRLPQADAAHVEHPERIGRYRIENVLGKGGFGLVFLARDEQLDRLVAIKVPHAKLITKPKDAEAYLAEARTVANLDHPSIVPVHDVGSTEHCPCFVVSKYVEGTDLARKMKESRVSYRDAAELVATVAEALHYAHKQGLVHRDVKPGNILIDGDGKPFVVDFGLALREENIGKGPKYAGTPAYMSPEQARGEGHRVDGRSDIFSLGVVLYELLSGRKPFRGDTQAELIEQVTSYEAKPLRQFDEKLPKELERICHKAMAKRASERYYSAHDMAEDLRLFLQEQTANQSGTSLGGVTSVAPETHASQIASTSLESSTASSASFGTGSDSQPIKIVPKGLRSFDAHDADFFLELLPGPRDRNGLPDSLRFWKTRIEETDPDSTFSVGLIYGPSGCGKSSLVKAGLLPRLSEEVIPVYIEATPEETETRLLHGLRRRCPAIGDNLSLKDTLSALRRGQGVPVGKKVLIVLDQFEQWLHANKEAENSDLVQALRQCDGGRVQCVVMVRDDFWLAVSRFLRELEIRLVEGKNSALIDLFDLDHARKVLAHFGRAYGKLPDNINETTKEQKDFIKQAVAGLAEESKVICVRLALFAEMMKGKTWTPATLKKVGGTKGVGATFLEETFSASTSPPEHRYHQKAARAVLKDLLPDSGTNIKGTMRSYAELLEASGYGNRPKDFDDLICILDSEIRLITPTDPEGMDLDEDSATQLRAGQKYFQLTHDYLVHSLRDWLTRKQKETRKGRAELKLFDTSVTWNAKPENRFLPSWWEHLTICLLTDKQRWTQPQRKMMNNAGRVHGVRSTLVALLLVAASFIGLSIRNSVRDSQNFTRAEGLVESLVNAEVSQVPAVIADLQAYRPWADPLLQTKLKEVADGSPKKLQVALALLPGDESQLDYLSKRLPVCTLNQFSVLRESLLPHKDKLIESLWQVATDEERDAAKRFQAAAALAQYSPDHERWQQAASFVSQHLTTAVSSVFVERWRALLQPAREQLTASLTAIHADRNRSEKQRETSALVLSDFLRDQPDRLTDVILVADELAEFSLLMSSLRPYAAAVQQPLLAEIQATMPTELDKTNEKLSEADQQRRDAHWRRKSLAAVALLQLGYAEDVWSLMKMTSNPTLRSFVIYHLGKLETDQNTLAARLRLETDVSIRRALIQSLGGLSAELVPPSDRKRITKQLEALYVDDPDSGIHGSVSWTLRQWGVPLPELSVGEPSLTDEQQERILTLTQEVESLQQRIATAETERPLRQAAWEQSLSKRTIHEPASFTEGLISHYLLDEATGYVVRNAVDGAPDASFDADKLQWISGVLHNAARLNGKTDIIAEAALNLESNDAFSYGCWFTFNKTPRVLLSTRDKTKGHRGFDLSVEDGNRLQVIIAGEPPDISDSQRSRFSPHFIQLRTVVTVASEAWHHVLVCYNGSEQAAGIKLYIDGQSVEVSVAKDSLEGTIKSDTPLHVGSRHGSFRLSGAIDDVRVYNRVVSNAEALQLYEAGVRTLAGGLTEDRDEAQQALLSRHYAGIDTSVAGLRGELSALERKLRDARWDGIRRWYINAQGQTMVVIPSPRAFGNGSIDHSYAIASHEVTVAEFRRFREQHEVNESLAPTEDCPVHFVPWYNAAAYCNWLSEQEGIAEDQWVYEPNNDGQYAVGMLTRENAVELTGYRLPTVAEWEFACRAGSSGTFGFGESVSLLERYAWCGINSSGRTYPIGSLLPNAAGIFDTHGNLAEWVQDHKTGPLTTVGSRRLLKGGAFFQRAAMVRCGISMVSQATHRADTTGIRPVRTYRLSP